MTYTKENIPTTTILELLEDNWDENQGEIPKPQLEEATSVEPRINIALEGTDLVIIRLEDSGIQEKWRSNYFYYDVIVNLRLELFTQTSRQRLYDMMQEIRRVMRSKKHNITGYQLGRYNSFSELTNEQLNIWGGILRISLESAGKAM